VAIYVCNKCSNFNFDNLNKIRANTPAGWKKAQWTSPRLPSKFVGGVHGITRGSYRDTFMAIFDESLQSNAIAFTNQYAKENEIRYNGKIIQIHLDDLLHYFAVITVMGLCPQPEIADYWKSSPSIFGNWTIKRLMPRCKFEAIHRAFHMDNDIILKLLNLKIRSVYSPSNYVTVDETILPTKSRNPHRQHVRGKPKATGCKLFTVCDSNSIPVGFWFYYKKKDGESKTDSRNWSETITDYVLDLVRVLPGYYYGRKYVITADQFYGHLETAREIINDGHYFIFSCQSNRPSYLFSDYLHHLVPKQGDVEFLVSDDDKLCCLTMYDCKKCNFLFNCSSPTVESVMPNGKTGRLKPEVIRNYNLQTHDVDRFDQHLSLYAFKHRIVSWKKSVSIKLIKFIQVISWRFQTLLSNTEFTQRDFLVSLVQEFIGYVKLCKPLANSHLIEYQQHGTGKCVYCLKEKGRHAGNTKFKCRTCKTWLHPKCCYIWHTKYM